MNIIELLLLIILLTARFSYLCAIGPSYDVYPLIVSKIEYPRRLYTYYTKTNVLTKVEYKIFDTL